MSKKVLILSSSFRKGGNSDTLCDQFAMGARDAGHAVEKIFLNDKHIGYCRGCGVCNTTHKCIQKDDMAEILNKMVEADVIVMGTPVYFYSMNGQMKTLIDRTVPRYEEISGKEFTLLLRPQIQAMPTWRKRWRLFSALQTTVCPGATGKRRHLRHRRLENRRHKNLTGNAGGIRSRQKHLISGKGANVLRRPAQPVEVLFCAP